ncbi:MFS transporter [Tichowtungia aerotolerans]|uniref:MFS transporter n=1 Tax=Tichowtungia aerotolerans TaxID=2697043 RepID=A0A6P1MA24_9BACT|nr:MFS transporter [Tichowtungia aerotolerans]QHI70777.1 MFS transporter [Tichowtungia aerotolerans]
MNQNKQHETPAEERVSLKNKIGFGTGAVAECIMGNSIGQMANYVLNIGLGVRPELVGMLLSLPRIWDAFTDPVVGSWSDNFRSRWGRRRPFVFAGALLSALIFAAMWFLPRGWSEMQYFWYFLVMSLLYYTAYTIWVVPWTAMGCELTGDYNERTRVMAYRTFFMSVGGFVPAWLFALTELPFFADNVEGARYVGCGTALVMLLFGLVPVFFAKERYDVKIQSQARMKLAGGLKATLTNRPFVLLNVIVLTVCAGLFMINGLDPYVNIYYVWGGERASAAVWVGWSSLAYQVSGILFVAPVSILARHKGKRFALSFFLVISLIAALLKWVCYNPAHPWLIIIPSFLMSSGLCALWTLSNSMIADICDVGELETGRRMEGAFNAVGGWIRKMGLSLALLISGYVISSTGFNAALGADQSESTLQWMRILAVSIPAAMILISLILLRFYSLTESAVHEVKVKLAARKTDEGL